VAAAADVAAADVAAVAAVAAVRMLRLFRQSSAARCTFAILPAHHFN